MDPGAVYSSTKNPPNSSANARAVLVVDLADVASNWVAGPPTVLLCTLTPKATLGGIYLNENSLTDTP